MLQCFLDPNKEIPCSVYIGQEAGKELLNEILHAKHSIKIISPYLSADFVDLLINKKRQNIDVQLITNDEIKDYHDNKNTYNLIKQKQTIIDEAKVQMEKLEEINKILCYSMIALTVLIVSIYYFLPNIQVLLGLIIVILLYFIQKIYISKMKNLKIYNYSYHQTFPFKIFASKETTGNINDYLVHSKIYIIDNKMVFLGSSNFTKSGTIYNIETMIKTKDDEAIKKIKEFFNFTMNDLVKNHYDFTYWGKQLYFEKINDYVNKKGLCFLKQ